MKCKLYSLIIIIVLSTNSFLACKSKVKQEDAFANMTEYQSVHLEMTLYYPPTWKIFESSEGVLMAKDVEILIASEEEKLVDSGDFLASISLVDNAQLKSFIELLQTTLQLPQINSDDFILSPSANFQTLSTGISSETIKTIQGSFQDIFSTPLKEEYIFAYVDSIIIIGESNIISDSGDKIIKADIVSQPKTYYLIKEIKEDIMAIATVQYIERFSDSQDILQIINTIKSVKIDID